MEEELIHKLQFLRRSSAVFSYYELYPEASDTRVGEPKRTSRPQDVHLSRKFRIIVKTFVAVNICVIGQTFDFCHQSNSYR